MEDAKKIKKNKKKYKKIRETGSSMVLINIQCVWFYKITVSNNNLNVFYLCGYIWLCKWGIIKTL